jgi:hypothetical protein
MNQITVGDSTHELGWWLGILTAQPLCLYYFGAFTTHQEAESQQAEFIEDLLQENALILSTKLQFLQPNQITLIGDDLRSHIHGFRKLPKPRRIAATQIV